MFALTGSSGKSKAPGKGRRGCQDPWIGRRKLAKLAHPANRETEEVRCTAKTVLRCLYLIKRLARYPDPRKMIDVGHQNRERARRSLKLFPQR
jgi:hypothetical protein